MIENIIVCTIRRSLSSFKKYLVRVKISIFIRLSIKQSIHQIIFHLHLRTWHMLYITFMKRKMTFQISIISYQKVISCEEITKKFDIMLLSRNSLIVSYLLFEKNIFCMMFIIFFSEINASYSSNFMKVFPQMITKVKESYSYNSSKYIVLSNLFFNMVVGDYSSFLRYFRKLKCCESNHNQ